MQSQDYQNAQQRLVFLLTCWMVQDEDAQSWEWHFKLEKPGPDRGRVFTGLAEMMEAIKEELQNEGLRR